jgi:hypothetical protein
MAGSGLVVVGEIVRELVHAVRTVASTTSATGTKARNLTVLIPS